MKHPCPKQLTGPPFVGSGLRKSAGTVLAMPDESENCALVLYTGAYSSARYTGQNGYGILVLVLVYI